MIVKVFARLYKYTPEQVMDLTLAQVLCLLPDSVERAIEESMGLEVRGQHMAGAIASLRSKFPERSTFMPEEINAEQWDLYA